MHRSSRGIALVMILSALALLAASCGGDSKKNPMAPGGGGGGGGGGTADVVIHILAGAAQAGSNAYSPNPATVTVGQTVQWVNDDNMTHTATANGGSFNTGSVTGGSTSGIITMSAQGSFPYHCAVAGHNMAGTVNVNP
jgi:plastocyanin